MHILVTNDDGVDHLGLQALFNTASKFGKVSVLAPNRNWSGCGHIKTLDRPLRVYNSALPDGTLALCSDGAPSDCVALAMLGIIEPRPDLVLTGINNSANLGDDVTYSGTVMAAMEGMIHGVPAVAFSQERPKKQPQDFRVTEKVIAHILFHLTKEGLPTGVFLNVNVPDLTADQLKGIRVTRLGKRIYHDQLDKKLDPRGGNYYWIGGKAPTGQYEPDTDIGALQDGYASITPLQGNMTAPINLDWNL